MTTFYPLEVKEIRKETADAVSIILEVPSDLRDKFTFNAGQHLTFKMTIEGEEIRRSYSICSSPNGEVLQVAIKRIAGGLFSTYATETLKVGDKLDVMPPLGHFYTDINPDNSKRYVAFTAGSGITPIMSNVLAILEGEENSSVCLIYGNKDYKSIIFKEEIEDLKNTYLDRFEFYHMLSREPEMPHMFEGRITVDKCKELEKITSLMDADEYLLCGPEEMINSVGDWLKESGISKDKIHFELFVTASLLAENGGVSTERQELAESEHNAVEIILDGKVYSYNMGDGIDNILDGAMEAGADAPFSCKGGVCCTCRAKVLEGEVKMELNYALTEEEVEEGFVLTCQAYPVSKKVKIDFDHI
mgnify:CR=1 FL=1